MVVSAKAKNGLVLSAKPFSKTGGGTGGGQREEAGFARRNDSQSPVQQRVKEVDTLKQGMKTTGFHTLFCCNPKTSMAAGRMFSGSR